MNHAVATMEAYTVCFGSESSGATRLVVKHRISTDRPRDSLRLGPTAGGRECSRMLSRRTHTERREKDRGQSGSRVHIDKMDAQR